MRDGVNILAVLKYIRVPLSVDNPFEVNVTPLGDGTTDGSDAAANSATILELTRQRAKCKLLKDFPRADEIRDQLLKEFDMVVEDNVSKTEAVFQCMPIAEKERRAVVKRADQQARVLEQQRLSRREKKRSRRNQCKSMRKTKSESTTIEAVNRAPLLDHGGSSESGSSSDSSGPRYRLLRNRKVKRHRCGKKQRFAAFSQWLLHRFQLGKHPSTVHVLDVAGGNGSLSWVLLMEQDKAKVHVTVVDPRHIALSAHKTQVLVDHAKAQPENSVQSAMNISVSSSSGVENKVLLHPSIESSISSSDAEHAREYFSSRGWRQLRRLFDDKFCSEQQQVWEQIDIVLGLHPDEATDAVVDMALKHGKPFAVVPCCVFPTLFPHRKLEGGKQVRSREELCRFLASKHPGIQSEELPSDFPGPCNTVLWWNGKQQG